MNDISEIKQWLKIDGDDDGLTLASLLIASKMIIKQSTGVLPEDVTENGDALELYKLIQKIIITDLYENRTGNQKMNPVLISLCTQLEAYNLTLAGGTV